MLKLADFLKLIGLLFCLLLFKLLFANKPVYCYMIYSVGLSMKYKFDFNSQIFDLFVFNVITFCLNIKEIHSASDVQYTVVLCN